MKTSSVLLAATFVLGTVSAAHAQFATNDAGMTLYTYDNDAGGASTCYDDCAVNWPPFLGTEGETRGEGWTLVARTDGTMQWAHDGKPVYLYHEDMAAGDAKGDGEGGVWHALPQPQ